MALIAGHRPFRTRPPARPPRCGTQGPGPPDRAGHRWFRFSSSGVTTRSPVTPEAFPRCLPGTPPRRRSRRNSAVAVRSRVRSPVDPTRRGSRSGDPGEVGNQDPRYRPRLFGGAALSHSCACLSELSGVEGLLHLDDAGRPLRETSILCDTEVPLNGADRVRADQAIDLGAHHLLDRSDDG